MCCSSPSTHACTHTHTRSGAWGSRTQLILQTHKQAEDHGEVEPGRSLHTHTHSRPWGSRTRQILHTHTQAEDHGEVEPGRSLHTHTLKTMGNRTQQILLQKKNLKPPCTVSPRPAGDTGHREAGSSDQPSVPCTLIRAASDGS